MKEYYMKNRCTRKLLTTLSTKPSPCDPPKHKYKPSSILIGLERLQYKSQSTCAQVPQEYFHQNSLNYCFVCVDSVPYKGIKYE